MTLAELTHDDYKRLLVSLEVPAQGFGTFDQPGYEEAGLPYLPSWAQTHWPEPTDDIRFVFWFDN